MGEEIISTTNRYPIKRRRRQYERKIKNPEKGDNMVMDFCNTGLYGIAYLYYSSDDI